MNETANSFTLALGTLQDRTSNAIEWKRSASSLVYHANTNTLRVWQDLSSNNYNWAVLGYADVFSLDMQAMGSKPSILEAQKEAEAYLMKIYLDGLTTLEKIYKNNEEAKNLVNAWISETD